MQGERSTWADGRHIARLRDPAVGSPTGHLKNQARQMQQAYAEAIGRVAWDKVNPEKRTALKDLGGRLLGHFSKSHCYRFAYK